MSSFRFALVALLLFAPRVANADSEEPEPPPPPRPHPSAPPIELAVGADFGTTNVGHASFSASGVGDASFHGSGRDLGFDKPFTVGFHVHGLYFLTPRFGFGVSARGAQGWSGGAPSPGAAAIGPGAIGMVAVGLVAEGIVVDGPTSLRLGTVFGGNLTNVRLGDPAYAYRTGRHGAAAAGFAFLSPHVSIVQRIGFVELGASLGLEFVSSDPQAPGVAGGIFIGLRGGAAHE